MTKEQAYIKIKQLVDRFNEQLPYYKKSDYNETQTRREFIDPFFKALGWDIDNEQGLAEAYKDVIHEYKLKIKESTKAPDYCFTLSGQPKFFVEAKKPSVFIKEDITPAYQVKRYGWNAKLSISIVTDFEEFAIYDCTKKPNVKDKTATGRIKYLTFNEYLTEFDFLWETFAKERVLRGSFDKFVKSDTSKKGTSTVDYDFLQSMEEWRKYLATNIAINNHSFEEDDINFVVQQTLDRIIFLRICEDRSIEPTGRLKATLTAKGTIYNQLFDYFKEADAKYNSGLFDFKKDKLSETVIIDNKVLKTIITDLEESPYLFNIIPVEILGYAYEQFLGKVIRITSGHRVKIEEKPEVRKAGGVFYTPKYIVDYIVQNTVGKIIDGKTAEQVSKIKILDPACGSGSFLLGAYEYLLKWHTDYYNKKSKKTKQPQLTPEGNLTSSIKKQILINNIFGVDLDEQAVEVTKLSLLLKCLEGETNASITHQMTMFKERVLPNLDNNIKSGNSLIDTDFYDHQLDFGEEKKIKPFNWQKEFPTVFNREIETEKNELRLIANKAKTHAKKAMEYATALEEKLNVVSEPPMHYETKKNGGFDVVIGNPPYVKVVDVNLNKYFNEKYVHQDYQQDLYLLFLEKYKHLLIESGQLGIIIPNTWLQSIKFRNIRNYLVNQYYWNKVLHLKEYVFSAIVDTHVLLFEKQNKLKNKEVQIDTYNKNEVKLLQLINQYSLPSNGDVINILSSKEDTNLFEKIKKKSTTIKENCFTNIGVKPFQIGKGKPKQTQKIVNEKPYVAEKQTKPKGENWLPLMRGSLMNRYTNYWNNDSWIQYGEWLAEPRNYEVFKANEKIIVRQTGDSIIATIIGKNIICRNNLHVILSNQLSHYFILGILNSHLTNFYYQQINPEKGEALAEVKKNHVEQLPLPIMVTSQQQSLIINYVTQLLELNANLQTVKLDSQRQQVQSKINYYEDKINKLVYALYQLTESEILLIENSMKK